MRNAQRWLNWRYEERNGAHKPTKVPIAPISLTPASTTDPAGWTDLQTAYQAYQVHEQLAGIGFVFAAEDGLTGIDIDDAFLADKGGAMKPVAQAIVQQMNSFTETSVSGKGIHTIIRARMPEGKGRKNTAQGLEFYSQGRYFTVSTRAVPGSPLQILERQAELESLLRELFQDAQSPHSQPLVIPGPGNRDTLSDDDLLLRASAAPNGDKFTALWNGDWRGAGYPSQSEADLAFCSMLSFWTNRDPGRIDELYRRSGLYRPKWEREDYHTSVIMKAMQGGDGYSPAPYSLHDPFAAARASLSAGATPMGPRRHTDHEMLVEDVFNRGKSVAQAVVHAGIMAKIAAQYGDPFIKTDKGLVINHMFMAAFHHATQWILYDPDERSFFVYAKDRGLWISATEEFVKVVLFSDLKNMADAQRDPRFAVKSTDAVLTSIVKLLRGVAEQKSPFSVRHRMLHVDVGMLDLSVQPTELKPFAPQYFSRNQISMHYDPAATCPRFLSELLAPAIDPEDIDLIQRWGGMVLLGTNGAQKIMLHIGKGGAGKGVFANIIEAIIGDENVTELRTHLLSERFELVGYLGKTLLTGKDVPGSFLNDRGAQKLKALVGNDQLSPEIKGGGKIKLRGNFNVLITSNSRLRVKLDADIEAWRRRLLIVNWKLVENRKRIERFDEVLLKEEGPGILNWMIEGAKRAIRELDLHGDILLTQNQKERVESLLAESDSVRHFVKKCVIRDHRCDVTVAELTTAHTDFCESMGWEPETVRRVENVLADVMLDVHRVAKRTDIKRDGRSQRGFMHVRLSDEYS